MVANAADKKPLSVAIDELYKGKVKIVAPEEEMKKEQLAAEAQTEESGNRFPQKR